MNDFQSIKSLIASQGTGSTSVLYQNFWPSKATGATAVSFDDEMLDDVGTTVTFGVILADMGFHRLRPLPGTKTSGPRRSRRPTASAPAPWIGFISRPTPAERATTPPPEHPVRRSHGRSRPLELARRRSCTQGMARAPS